MLSLLQDGNCSDLEVDDADEEFFGSQLESEELVSIKEPCAANPTQPRKGGKERKTPTIDVQNKELTASNCTGGTTIEIVKRYDKKQKCYIDIDAPKIVTSYNSFMGCVDVLDQSMEYYRTFMKTRKWTLKVILHFMDLAVVNAWRLYRCDCLAKGIPKNRIQDLLAFRFEIAETLINTPDRERLESSPLIDIQNNMTSRYKPANNPSVGKRYDGYDHLPAFDDIKAPRKCRFESCSSRSKIRCRKCDVYLCLSRDKDCFYLYHSK